MKEKNKKPKLRIPLPNQVEKIIVPKKQYKRSREKEKIKEIIEEDLKDSNEYGKSILYEIIKHSRSR